MSRSKDLWRRLAALRRLEGGDRMTQRALAAHLNISLGLGHAVLHRLEQEGLVTVSSEDSDARARRYAVTAAGRREIARATAGVAVEAGDALRAPREALRDAARRWAAEGRRRALLGGSGPLADVAASALLEGGMRLAGVVAADPEAARVAGVPVDASRGAARVACDVAVAVTPRDAALLRKRVAKTVPIIRFPAPPAGGGASRE